MPPIPFDLLDGGFLILGGTLPTIDPPIPFDLLDGGFRMFGGIPPTSISLLPTRTAILIEIADAVTAELNSASLSQTFLAARSYVPVDDIAEMADLKVRVVPSGVVGNIIDRSGRQLFDYTIDVTVQKRLATGPLTEAERNAIVDPLMFLAQEIVDLFNGIVLALVYDSLAPRCVDVKNIPAFAPHHMDEERLFTSLITLNFKLGR